MDGVNAEAQAEVLREARDRFRRAQEWESQWRTRFLEDLKFRHGDSVNMWQWPEELRGPRVGANRPCLTLNNVRQHNLQISNQLRKNKSSVGFVGTGNGATQESAAVMKDLFRRVEYQSNAQAAFTLARNFQIDGGCGYWRLRTGYASDDTFDQDIWIDPIIDPMSVYLDPSAKRSDRADARWGLVFDIVPDEQLKETYPELEDVLSGTAPLGEGPGGWTGVLKDQTMIVEYFRKVGRDDTLVSFVHGGARHTIRKSHLHESMHGVLGHPATRTRGISLTEVEHYIIAGDRVLDQTVWPSKYLPIVACLGEETRIEGRLDRKGHTRAMMDAQRMYNVNASQSVEFASLQGKTPWIAPAEAIEELEQIWNTANTVNHAVLPYKHVDSRGQPIPPPQRTQPPVTSPAFESGMTTAWNQMMMTSGQYQNQMGMMGNERTGTAIRGRQEQSETAVFHFQDNYEEALQHTGRVFLDLVPRVYDTKRVLRIMAEDGTESDVELNPAARALYFQEVGHRNEVVRRVLNPTIGSYEVAASVGVAYGTKRAETQEMLGNLMMQAPALAGLVADLFLGSMDFEKAQEAALRLRRMLPPQALGQGPTPSEQAAQAQIAQLQAALSEALQKLGKEQLKLVGKDQMRDIDVYEAETKRYAALKDALGLDPQGARQAIDQLVRDSMGVHLGSIIEANASSIDPDGPGEAGSPGPSLSTEAPPMPGARKAPDGEWYMLDPTRRSKYLRIGGLASQGPRR